MAAEIHLALAIHNHQPVGNFDWVFRQAYENAYLPLVECLERHPGVRLALHYSGPLRDWLAENRPDFLPRVREMAQRGQVEVMAGAYYEPILVALRDIDKRGQISKQIESVRRDFGCDPGGLWLAERVWEPHLPAVLNEAGITYTILDDAHFKAVGYTDDDLLGYYVTEERGRPLKVFATSMPLRYGIPWWDVEKVIDWLREQAEAADHTGRYAGRPRVAVMGDDGEKFGLWPGTFRLVWEDGWMDHFFEALEASADWLHTILPGEAARQFPALGRIYLPSSSYEEMGEWAMPPDAAYELPHLKQQMEREGRTDVLRYMRGGLWRQFMVKYDEVNQLHKKAAWVSSKVHAMRQGRRKQRALDHLWAGQCNCAYWHGVFGGIYLFHIRQADYEHLIRAENLADGLDTPDLTPFARADVVDFDGDAVDDVVLASDRQSLVFDVDQGGGLVEWDYRPLHLNLLNVMTRRREGYHRELTDAVEAGRLVTPDTPAAPASADRPHERVVRARERDLHTRLITDWHRRASLLDHFLGPETTLDGFYRSRYPELGDFVNQPYTQEVTSGRGGGQVLTLRRDGHVWQGGFRIPASVQKVVTLEPGSEKLTVHYSVRNGDGGELNARFGVETAWGLVDGSGDHTYLSSGFGRYSLGEIAANEDVTDLAILSRLWGIRIDVGLDRASGLWRFPLETISLSESGFERIYQGSTLLFCWPIRLGPGASWQVTITFSLKAL